MIQALVFVLCVSSIASASAWELTRGEQNWSSVLFKYWNPLDTCPDLNHVREKECRTGSCQDNLLVGLYLPPTDCALLTITDYGEALLTGEFFAAFADVIEYNDDNPATDLPVDPFTGYNFSAYGTVNNENPVALVNEPVLALQKDYPSECCKSCKNAFDGSPGEPNWGFKCDFYQQFFLGGPSSGQGLCLLYSGDKYRPQCGNTTLDMESLNFIGATCKTHVIHDPHFVGAHGTPFDFSGVPNEAFNLISDERLIINTMLTGYLDSRTESATLIKDGKAVRTWIRELGILFSDSKGKVHRLRMAARSGPEVARGNGFIESVTLDGAAVTVPQVYGVFTSGDLTLKYVSQEKKGSADVDYFRLIIDGVMDADIRLRVAHPLLRTPEDAYAHFSIGFNTLENTQNIHGVLGQTFRKDHRERAIKFSQLAAMLHHNIRADDVEGAGFLDGEAFEYKVPDVLSTDFKYNAFLAGSKPAVVAGAADLPEEAVKMEVTAAV